MKRSILKYCLTFIGLIGMFFLFALVSCWLPDRRIKEHVTEIAPVMQECGNYPMAIIQKESARQDNFTDALILNQQLCIDRKFPLKSAMSAYRCEYSPRYDMTSALLKLSQQEEGGTMVAYPRYWHGNTFLFRVMLLFVDYQTLQWMMFAVSSLLLFLFLLSYQVRAGIWKAMAFLLSWLLVYGFVTQFSMQFFPVTVLMLIASILVVRHAEDHAYLKMLFFVMACLTCYFDLLTTPLLTLGWPLLVWVSLQNTDSLRLQDSLFPIVGWGFLWGVGYALTFLSKWLISSAIINMNVLKDASESTVYRMGVNAFSRWDAIVQNVQMVPWTMVFIVLLVLGAYSIVRFHAKGGLKTLLLLAVSLLPYVWYLLVANHSFLHYWFTYRLQAITIAALFLMVLSMRREPAGG